MDTTSVNYVQQRQFIRDLATLSYVDKILLYGSRARGDHSKYSDIDLAIFANCNAQQWQQIMDIVEQADTLLDIDCIDYNRLSSDSPLKTNIDTDGVILYDKQSR